MVDSEFESRKRLEGFSIELQNPEGRVRQLRSVGVEEGQVRLVGRRRSKE